MQHGVHGSSHSHENHCHQSCYSFQSPLFPNPNFHLSPCACCCCCCCWRSGIHFHLPLYKRMCKRGLTILAKLFGSCINMLNVPRFRTCGGKVWGLWVGLDNGLMILWSCFNAEQFQVFWSIDQCHWSFSVAGYANQFELLVHCHTGFLFPRPAATFLHFYSFVSRASMVIILSNIAIYLLLFLLYLFFFQFLALVLNVYESWIKKGCHVVLSIFFP